MSPKTVISQAKNSNFSGLKLFSEDIILNLL